MVLGKSTVLKPALGMLAVTMHAHACACNFVRRSPANPVEGRKPQARVFEGHVCEETRTRNAYRLAFARLHRVAVVMPSEEQVAGEEGRRGSVVCARAVQGGQGGPGFRF
jgi:hypothetical protein